MSGLTAQKIEREQKNLQRISASRAFAHPEYLIDGYRARVAEREVELERAINQTVSQRMQSLRSVSQRLEALSPLAVLSRGYAAVSQNDKTVLSADALQAGDHVTIRFMDGTVQAEITE